MLLEGPAIEPLLAQVREEYGPAARIISADKVRRGGLGGFFTREHYEISIEIDDTADVKARPAGPSGPGAGAVGGSDGPSDGLLALVEASQDRFRRLPTPDKPPTPATAPGPAEPPAPARPAGLPTPPTAGWRPANTMGGTGWPANLTTSGGAASADAPSAPPAEPTTKSAQPGETVGPPARAGLVSTANPGFAEVLAGLRGGLKDDLTAPADGSGASDQPTATITDLPDPTPTPRPAPDPGPAPAAAPVAAPTPTPAADGAAPCAGLLEQLGVPAAMARHSTAAELYPAALQSLATIPPAPGLPTAPGDVLVLLGELPAAMSAARDIAERLRIGPSRMYVVADSLVGTGLHASRRIADAGQAAKKAQSLRAADSPHIVVVDVPLTGRPGGWASKICTALDASDVWAVIDATRKSADTAAHLTSMGEVDALAAYGLATTADPASVLGLGLPVALLDGAPATSHAWAALLADRVGAAPKPRRRRRRGATPEEDS
ncbi:hypothetical protein GCM10010201_10730 [Pilimelia columellifera subsp. columellifera]|uniref:Uncharacterized protein n=1 Tax=Pilimelia columellifera subsp. columellifera TaxID=706583 RepID=A0ABP6AFY3_9ACTN